MTSQPDADPSARSVALGPHGLAQRVDCRICFAPPEQPCDDDGAVRDDPHHSRWMRYQRLVRGHQFLAVCTRPSPPLHDVGDVVLCVTADDSRQVRVVGDRLGRRFAGPSTLDADAVQFMSFVDDRPVRGRAGRAPASPHGD